MVAASHAAAAAPKGLIGFFGTAPGTATTGTAAGQMNTPRGVAVNQANGSVYAVDSGNNRVVVFNSSGTFLRAFGADVVAFGPGQVSETGFEICVPANGDACKAGASGAAGGALNTPQGIAINQASGALYVTEQGNRRVSQFDSSGNFIRAFGRDVVATGSPGNSPAASAVQTLTVSATSGKYKLKFGGSETAELPHNAGAAEIQAALQGLASIGAGNALVTGTGPYTVTFGGALANNPEPLITTESGPGDPLIGGTATIVNTTTGSNEFEICAAGNICKAAAAANATAGGFGAAMGYPAVAPAGAPNPGGVLIADPANQRVQEFTSNGAFLRAFGHDVVAAGPGNNGTAFEVCSAFSGDACKAGTAGEASGQFAANTPTRVAEDASGNLYTVEPTTSFRVQKFTLPGNLVTPQGAFGPADLTGGSTANAPLDVTVSPTADSNLLVIKAFPAAATPGCPITGSPSAVEHRVLEVTAAGALEDTHAACAGIIPANGLAVRQSSGDVYLSSTFGASRLYVLNTGQPAAPTASISSVSGIDAHGATVSALINPNGLDLPYGNQTTYRLEYKRTADASYTPLESLEASAGNGNAGKPVAQRLEGLQAATSYDVRLTATKPFGSGGATATATFSTAAAPPEPIVAPSVFRSGTSATFAGTVNPNNSPTAYRFEYVADASFQVSGFAEATRVPSPDAGAGSGGTPVPVAEELMGLAPGTTYHLRLTATNALGIAASTPTTFSVEASGACENEAIRQAQKSETLPNGTTSMPVCMALEMVSPAGKENQPVKDGEIQPNNSISVDGEHVLFRSLASLAETAGVVNVDSGDVYVASREKGGWTTRTTILRPMWSASEPKGLAPNLGNWFQVSPETIEQNQESKYQAFKSTLGGHAGPFSPPLLTWEAPPASASYAGSSEDALRLYVRFDSPFGVLSGSPARLLPGDPRPAGELSRPNIYAIALGADGQPAPPQLLARDKFGKAWGANCGARVGGDIDASAFQVATPQRTRVQGAISKDGSRVYFSTRPFQPQGTNCNGTNNKMRILERLETSDDPENPEAVITDLIQSECTRTASACDMTDGDDNFQGASADGKRIYFTTTRQLVNSDLDTGTSCGLNLGGATGCDLYLYEKLPIGGHSLVQVSAGDATDPTPGAGARVLNNIAGISTDGSHVYFAAQGVLTTAPNQLGAVAKAGESNLYLYQRNADHPNGRTVFIGALAAGDAGELWGQAKTEAFGASSVWPVPAMNAAGEEIGGDGHVLLFRSKAPLTPNDDKDGLGRDVYRYESQTGSLQCVSCLPEEVDGVTGEARAAELAGLTNGKPQGPAFASLGRWVSEDGESVAFQTTASLLPSDTDTVEDEYLWRDGQLTLLPGADLSEAPTISGDGSVVAFRRAEQLLQPQDGDSVADMYVLRSGGGFPIPPVPPHCTGESCQEPFHSQPAPSTTASETASGNTVAERPPCKKHFVRKKGKCVRRPCKQGFARKKGKCVRRHSAKKDRRKQSPAAGSKQGGQK